MSGSQWGDYDGLLEVPCLSCRTELGSACHCTSSLGLSSPSVDSLIHRAVQDPHHPCASRALPLTPAEEQCLKSSWTTCDTTYRYSRNAHGVWECSNSPGISSPGFHKDPNFRSSHWSILKADNIFILTGISSPLYLVEESRIEKWYYSYW